MSVKFSTIKFNNQVLYGVERSDGFINLSEKFSYWPSLREVIENDGLEMLEQEADKLNITHLLGSFSYEIPIPRPEKIICVGVNYPDRNEEYKDGQSAPKNMSLFVRFARTFVGHKQSIIRPKASDQLDYEGEVAIVIGKTCRHISEKEAYSCIAGITICNEGTIRDWLRHAKFNVTQGKNFESSGSLGPFIIPFKDYYTDNFWNIIYCTF